MKTKTWQLDFEQKYWGKFGSTKTINDIKQFISDLRKKDEEALIEIMKDKFAPSDNFFTIDLIKDYYEN